MTQPIERLHSLDFLRGVMMFLGILLHGMLPFMETPVPFWPARDDDRSPLVDLFVFVVHDFRMQTFFFLAGFFGCLLYQRYGLAGMLRHRLLRIAVPFALALIIIQPGLQALWLLGDPSALHFLGIDVAAGKSIGERLADLFLTGCFVEYIRPFHMWFLYFLLVYFVLMIPLIGAGRLLAQRGRRPVEKLFAMPGKTILLAALTTPLVWPMRVWGMADTPEGWQPPTHLFAYYFFFFLAGWLLWLVRDQLNAFTRHWGWSLIVGNVLVLPTMLGLVFTAVDGMKGKTAMPGAGHHLATCFASALYTWLMIGGLTGAFRYFFSRERRWVRYLADASYWCYLWHLTPIVALQILLAHSPLPGIVQFAIIVGASLLVLLVSYEWCVRYSFIGAMLNGRKTRLPHIAPEISDVSSIASEPHHAGLDYRAR